MESSLTLHTILDNGLVLQVGPDWRSSVSDPMDDVRLPKKPRYCGEDRSRHSWDNRGMMSTEPPTPVLLEQGELVDEETPGMQDGIPMYISLGGQRSANESVRVLRLPDCPKPSVSSFVPGDASPASSSAARVRWSEDDDKLLILLVSELGHNWPQVANRMEGRTSKQVKERWTNQLDPSISTEPWTADDDQFLVELIRQVGHSWCEIARRMKGRTESMVKNRFHANLRKRFGSQIFDPNIPLPPLTFKPKSIKNKKVFISQELREAAADADAKALARKGSTFTLPPSSNYFGSDEES